MATRQKFEPGLYRVTNTGKRSRHRDGIKYPGLTDGKPVTREVQVTSRAQWMRLKACTSLEVTGPLKKSRGTGSKGGGNAGAGSGGDDGQGKGGDDK